MRSAANGGRGVPDLGAAHPLSESGLPERYPRLVGSPLPLRLYADECVDARIVAGLRRRGVDMVTAADAGMLGGADADHLARAIDLGRIVVSADSDFLRLAQECVEAAAPRREVPLAAAL